MSNRVALDNVAHQDLTVALRHGPAYGDCVNQMLLFPTEFVEAQREFPILFRDDPEEGLHAVALLGFDRDENLFFDGTRWTSRYIPAIQQRGPFSIGVSADGNADAGPVIHVDLDDPRIGAADGAALFLEHGGAGPYLDHIVRVLQRIYTGLEDAKTMYAQFQSLGLLESNVIEVRLNDEDRYRIDGFLMLSAERLAALPPEGLAQLHAAGHLGPAYMVAASLGNISAMIERKNACAAAA